jgi:hypothetical protein
LSIVKRIKYSGIEEVDAKDAGKYPEEHHCTNCIRKNTDVNCGTGSNVTVFLLVSYGTGGSDLQRQC